MVTAHGFQQYITAYEQKKKGGFHHNFNVKRQIHDTAGLSIRKIAERERAKANPERMNPEPVNVYPDSNIRKNKYNELLIKEYKDKEPVFDIAKFESTYSNGKRSTFTKQDKTWFSLAPEYTYDDGHLNETGRGKVAEQLLILLVNL